MRIVQKERPQSHRVKEKLRGSSRNFHCSLCVSVSLWQILCPNHPRISRVTSGDGGARLSYQSAAVEFGARLCDTVDCHLPIEPGGEFRQAFFQSDARLVSEDALG